MSDYESTHASTQSSSSTSHAGHDAAPKSRPAATAGPDQDDRFGAGPLAVDLEGRIIGRMVEGKLIRILIGVGAKHGVRIGMPGYVTGKYHHPADFQIDKADEGTCSALVDATHDQLTQGTLRVMINPRSMM